MILALLYVGSYLLGSVPFGVILSRLGGVEILREGSGNPGATNVWRNLGWRYGLPVFILDVAKGWAPAFVGAQVTGSKEQALACGLLAILGHSLSPFLKFKGGKGISTGLGALLGSIPLVAVSAFGVFLVSMAICRWVSLSSLLAAVSMVVCSFVFTEPVPIRFALALLAAYIFIRHRANIGRLMRGEEPKFSFRSKRKPLDKPDPSDESDEETPA